MKQLIVDVEATCWNSDEEKKGQQMEVIEIGYSIIDNGKITQNGDIYVKPKFSSVSKFCTELTGITKETINKKGLTPKAAYTRLNKLFSSVDSWASYGYYDKNQLTKNAQMYGFELSMPKHENIRLMCAQKYFKSDVPQAAPTNPKDMLDKLKIKWEGRNHNGKDDALNIAKIYLICKEKDYFPY